MSEKISRNLALSLGLVSLLMVGAGCSGGATSNTAVDAGATMPAQTEPMLKADGDLNADLNGDMVGGDAMVNAGVGVTEKPPVTDPKPAAVKEFKITAKQWAFEPAEIKVKKGDKVRLVVSSIDVRHGFAIPEFGVNRTLEPNKTETIEFVADQQGSFTFFCSVFCGRGHSGQRGTLIVE